MTAVSFIAVSMIIGLVCGVGTAFAGEAKRRLRVLGQIAVLVAACCLVLALTALAGELRRS
jgi:hypothetical protein